MTTGVPDPDVLSEWARWYPQVPPVAFLLREVCVDRWLRIYSLPEGKRFPTSGFDYAELLRRHNMVAEDVLGDEAPCALLLLHTCKGRGVRAVGREAGLTTTGLPRLARLPEELWDATTGIFAAPMCIFGMSARWKRGTFDRFITEVAEDRSRGLVVSLESGRVYAPYDGGADLVFRTGVERDRARDRFRDWASPRANGL